MKKQMDKYEIIFLSIIWLIMFWISLLTNKYTEAILIINILLWIFGYYLKE